MQLSALTLILAMAMATPQSPATVARPLLATAISAAPIYIEAKVQRIPLRTAATGTRLEVLQESDQWVQVQFNDPQFGRRVGWIEAKHLNNERPELQPLDLSVPQPNIVPAESPNTAGTTPPRPLPAATNSSLSESDIAEAIKTGAAKKHLSHVVGVYGFDVILSGAMGRIASAAREAAIA